MKRVFKYLDKPLLIISIILFVVGLIMVFSSSNVTAYMTHAASPYNYFIKQGAFLLVGLIFSLIMIKFNTKLYGILSWTLFLGVGVSLFALLFIGKTKNQAISWYDLGLFSFQPSEFIKVISIIWMAEYYEKNKDNLSSYWVSLFPLFACGIIAILIFVQPDLGTTIIYLVIVFAIFLAEPVPKSIKTKLIFGGVGAIVLATFALLSSGKQLILERQLERLNFTRPCDRLLDTGNQVCNGYIAINNGGLTGKGLGNSTQKYLYLPEPYTDFIFTITVEELGSAIGVLIIILYMVVLYRILAIGRKSYTNRGSTICYGVAVYIFCHIAVNLMGIFGLIPMTGVPLPFMSYGGSFTICLIAALTAVQRVSVETGIRDQVKTENRLKNPKKKHA
ncbi:cell division membrane protein [Clostridium sp. CAG:417]|jgi:cell cycle protein|nr:cell division membrane protein [Clostridium sp. CAG:417]